MGKRLKEVLYETAKDLHEARTISEETMREFDAMCLPLVKNYTPAQIKCIRKRNHASKEK